MFNPLSKDDIGNIVTLLISELNNRLIDREISVELTEAATRFVIDNGYDPTYGARPLKRYLQKHVETLAARAILAGNVGMGDKIVIDIVDDKLSVL